MKIVLALGGNALQANPNDNSVEGQLESCRKTAESIVDLIEEGHIVTIVHGNGPQVGQIMNSIESGHRQNDNNVLFPFDVCGAFSQGYIGYHLQNAIEMELKKRNIKKAVGTVITQIIVDKEDEGFKNPTKPIGSFFSKEDAKRISKEKGYIMKEDAGRGYRRVVASPKPVDIVEKDVIRGLMSVDAIVISCGGGGIPVIIEEDSIKGAPAVIDKDFAAEKLAEIVDADLLLILTAVEGVFINFNKSNQKKLDKVTVKELDKYIDEDQFSPGSMLPKVEACKKFASFGKDKTAIIASLFKAKEALNGTSGTKIVNE